MTRTASHIAVAAAALVVGGLGATAFSNPDPAREGAAAPTQPAPPEEVRTVVVTKTIHRVRHVRVHRPAAAAAPPPAPVAVAPRPAPAPVATRRAVALRPTQPISTHTSGHSGTSTKHAITTHTSGHGGEGGGEHEGGGDD